MESPTRTPDPRQATHAARDAPAQEDCGEERRAVKLRLPMEQVMKLHTLRILQSTPISHFVESALDDYFARQRALREAPSEDR
jgi:hypothetical protein